jgi:hypothetical protein
MITSSINSFLIKTSSILIPKRYKDVYTFYLMSTIVSAFVSNINYRKDIDLNKYCNFGKLILKSSTPKILFLDETMYNLIKESDYDPLNTRIIKFNKEDLFLNEYKHLITDFELHTTCPEKDTIEYMFTQCNKTDWIKKAIDLNPFHTDNFIWVDFGIKHMSTCSDEEFVEKINNLNNKSYSNVRICSIWDLEPTYIYDIYKDIIWRFAGSIFGGNKYALLVFHEKMKEKCLEIIHTKNTIMWEVNIWYLIYLENKELFNHYTSNNHDDSVIYNY